MTFLAPWALAIGISAAAGMLVLHLVAQHRPAAYVLPTARFIPERDTLVSRAASRPTDLLLLALRMLLLLSAGAAFARPVFAPSRVPRARIVLLDRSFAVASDSEAIRRARAAGGDHTLLITFDTAAREPRPIAALDSLPTRGATARSAAAMGSISAALLSARRAAPALARVADSVELVLVSPVLASEFDSATDSIRAEWPGSVRVERVAGRPASRAPAIEHAIPLDDQLGPSLTYLPVRAGDDATRLVRHPFSSADSSVARAGAAVVRWDTTSAGPLRAEGLALGDDVVVAPLGRRALPEGGIVRARWADGAPAAREEALGAGCLRTVGVAIPAAGDVALRPSFQRIARGLLGPCGESTYGTIADAATMTRLSGPAHVAPSSAFRSPDTSSPLTPWLLGLALLSAIGELAVRGTTRPRTTVRT